MLNVENQPRSERNELIFRCLISTHMKGEVQINRSDSPLNISACVYWGSGCAGMDMWS